MLYRLQQPVFDPAMVPGASPGFPAFGVYGQVPINATIYELEKLRCNLCGEIFTANAPGDKTRRDYDAGAMAMIAILKYGYASSEQRTGIFTTGIISRIDDDKKITLFYTGRNHAGENITGLYRKRDPGKLPPIQMCDALSRNTTDEFKGILCNCLTHARRNFVGEIENFPEETTHVIEIFAEVYHAPDSARPSPIC